MKLVFPGKGGLHLMSRVGILLSETTSKKLLHVMDYLGEDAYHVITKSINTMYGAITEESRNEES